MLGIILFKIARAAVGEGTDVPLPNPLGEGTTISDVIKNIISALQVIAVPIVVLMVLVGAFKMITARGNPEAFKIGKMVILYAVIGYAILLLAGGINSVIADVLN